MQVARKADFKKGSSEERQLSRKKVPIFNGRNANHEGDPAKQITVIVILFHDTLSQQLVSDTGRRKKRIH
jgi:hypothetical protein